MSTEQSKDKMSDETLSIEEEDASTQAFVRELIFSLLESVEVYIYRNYELDAMIDFVVQCSCKAMSEIADLHFQGKSNVTRLPEYYLPKGRNVRVVPPPKLTDQQ